MKSIFKKEHSQDFLKRIDSLTPQTKANWGTMSVSQMLAHCNVAYEMAYEDKHEKPTGVKKLMLKLFVKNIVVGDKAYAKNGRTAPEFIVTDAKEFNIEKERLASYISKTQQLGTAHFEGKESHSFGSLSSSEWNNLFSKHLEHHLSQFGA